MSIRSVFSKRRWAVAGLAVIAGCTETGPMSSSTTNLVVNVAPLTLPGLSNVCYGITVENEVPQLVWSRSNVCSQRFGNGAGGDISYVGPCDSQEALHAVTLTIESVTDANNLVLGAGDWVNPCPVGDGCVLDVTCEENADTPVTFNLTVMRNAKQGFFDLAVEFEDVFCSGKIDCVDTSGEPIELLFDADGERAQTAVVALACTGGPGTGQTSQIHMTDVQIICGENTPLPMSFGQPLFGSCFDVGAANVISYGFSFTVALPAPIGPIGSEPDILYNRIFPQHVLHNSTATPVWDVNTIADATAPSPYDAAIVYTRLGTERALMVYIDHTDDYEATGPIPDVPSINGIGFGIGTWNNTASQWEAGPAIAAPAALSGVQFMLPESFDGTYLAVQVVGQSGMSTVVYPWNATALSFGSPTVVGGPTPGPNESLVWTELRDGFLLGEIRDSNDATISVWVAAASSGWVATELVMPANFAVPNGWIYAGYSLTPMPVPAPPAPAPPAPVLLTDGRVAIQALGTFDPDPNVTGDELSTLMMGLFTSNGTTWDFGAHPVYKRDYLGGSTLQWDLSQMTLQAAQPHAYSQHHTLQLADGPPVDMFKVYRDNGAGLPFIWDHYPTLAAADVDLDGTPDATILQLSIAGLVERTTGPALAAFSLGTSADPSGWQRLELGILGLATAGIGGDVIPLVTLLDENGQPARSPNGGWRLNRVERNGDFEFLLSFNNQGNTTYNWRVNVDVSGPNPTATALLVSVQTELTSAEPLYGGAFADDDQRRLEAGDATLAAVPGGCEGPGGLEGMLYAAGAIRTQPAQQQQAGVLPRQWAAYAGFDFTTGNPVVATTFGVGDDVLATINAVETQFSTSEGPYQVSLPPSATEGNQWDISTVPEGQPVWQHAVYAGEEALNCDGQPCNKIYYNTAVGFDPLEPNCTLYFAATASGGSTIVNGQVPAGHVYPVLVGQVQLTGADPATEGLLCDQHPLGSLGFGINYTPATSTGVQFCHTWDGSSLATHTIENGSCSYMSVAAAMRARLRLGGISTDTYAPVQGDARELPASGSRSAPSEPLP